MELNAITLGLNRTPSSEKHNYVEEVDKFLNSTLSTESLSDAFSVDFPGLLGGKIETKLSEYEGLSSRIIELLENLDNISDKQAMDTLLSIDPTAMERKPFMVEGTSSPAFKAEVRLATENWSERIRYGIIAILIGGILKLLSVALEGRSSRGKGSSNGGRGATSRQKEINDELTSLANDAAKEWVEKKYSVYSDIVKVEMIRLYNYASPGNLREPGGKSAGAAAEIAAEMVDYVATLDLEANAKETLLRGGFAILLTFIDKNVPMGHFGWSDKARKQVAKELINFIRGGYQGPMSRTMATMANVVNIEEGSSIRKTLLKHPEYKEDRLRLLNAHSLDDITGFIVRLESLSRTVSTYIGVKSDIREFGNRPATMVNRFLWCVLDPDSPDSQRVINAVVSDVSEEEEFYLAKPTNPLSKPTKNTTPITLVPNERNGVRGFNQPEGQRIQAVQKSAYFSIRNELNDLSGEDAPAAFAKYFYDLHGEYNSNNTIHSRLFDIGDWYGNSFKRLDSQLSELEKKYKGFYDVITQLGKDRSKNKGREFYVYDIPIKGMEIGALQKNGKFENASFDIPVGKHVENLLRTAKDTFASWNVLNAALDGYSQFYLKVK